MSLIVNGMSLPHSCRTCRFSYFTVGIKKRCEFSGNEVNPLIDKRETNCPLSEVPTPHGRLIDADALMECRLEPNHYEELKDGYIPDYDLDSAPTIIEAEVSDNA